MFAAGQRPEKIGLQPWEATEVWERLKAAMREYRNLSAANKDTRAVEQVVIFYAGWLGHYVGDASQPLHATVQYNGWTGPNPNGYTTEHKIHWQFEGPFVGANLHGPKCRLKSPPSRLWMGISSTPTLPTCAIQHVEKVYQLEKAGGFVGAGTPESREFTADRLAAAPACCAT